MIKSARHTVAIRTIAAAALVALAAPTAPAMAQAFPSRPITINSSVAAGASYEILLRTVAEDWQARTGATLIVNPMPGGLGTLAPSSLLRSPADKGKAWDDLCLAGQLAREQYAERKASEAD